MHDINMLRDKMLVRSYDMTAIEKRRSISGLNGFVTYKNNMQKKLK